MNFHGKTAGIIGTGKIGAAMARICHGFGMNIIAYDVFENPSIKDFVTYVTWTNCWHRVISSPCTAR